MQPLAELLSLVVSAMISTSVPRLFAARYPGMRTLCRRLSRAALLAGLSLGSLSALLGVAAAMEAGRAIMTGSGVVIAVQCVAWLLFLSSLPGRHAPCPFDERALMEALAGIAGIAHGRR